MPENRFHDDAEIIRSAYAERVIEAFKVFAENLSAGQSEQLCQERFRRSLLLVRKTRDLALQASSGEMVVEPGAPHPNSGAAGGGNADDALSAEDQAVVDQALAGTTGHAAVPVSRYRGR